jgi:hypothetical protein
VRQGLSPKLGIYIIPDADRGLLAGDSYTDVVEDLVEGKGLEMPVMVVAMEDKVPTKVSYTRYGGRYERADSERDARASERHCRFPGRSDQR